MLLWSIFSLEAVCEMCRHAFLCFTFGSDDLSFYEDHVAPTISGKYSSRYRYITVTLPLHYRYITVTIRRSHHLRHVLVK